jgi:hypothetical protein
VSTVLLASLSASSLTRTVLVILIASVVLLTVRVWNRSSNFTLPRVVSWLLDGTIIVLVVLFFLFVIIRFKTLA